MFQTPKSLYPYNFSSDGKKSSGIEDEGYARSKLRYWPPGFVLFSVPEHHPPSLSGHKSVTFTTTLGCVSGKKGGEAVYEFSRVNLKHLPQPGP